MKEKLNEKLNKKEDDGTNESFELVLGRDLTIEEKVVIRKIGELYTLLGIEVYAIRISNDEGDIYKDLKDEYNNITFTIYKSKDDSNPDIIKWKRKTQSIYEKCELLRQNCLEILDRWKKSKDGVKN